MTSRRSWRAVVALVASALPAGVLALYTPSASSQDAVNPPKTDSVAPFACYRTHGEKLLRIVESRTDCGAHETSLQLNQGPPGPPGPPGANGVEVQHVFGQSRYNSDGRKEAYAWCPTGTAVVGGGYTITGDVDVWKKVAVHSNGPSGDRGWSVSAIESEPVSYDWKVHASAVCARRAAK